ncbi:MAG: GC-type dockerin domain-anchored protein [Phycisphaerales bacterium]
MKQGCALGLALIAMSGMTGTVMAQVSIDADQEISDFEQPELRELAYELDSGIVGIQNRQAGARDMQVAVWEGVVEVPDAEWVRLRFSDVTLARSTENVRESYLKITSLYDGHEQYLDMKSLDEWGNTTAYFNGGAVKVEIMASPNATAQVNRVRVSGVQASAPVVGPRSICGSVDDRELSYDNRDARLMPIGCTAWLFDDHGSRMMSAAHCGPAGGDVIQFNVPLSTSGGSTQNPPPQDQYPVDNASVQESIGGIFIGNDWAYFGVFDNSNTGMSPGQTYGVHHTLATSQIPVDNRPIRITGYGSTSSPVPASWYLVQKTHVGAFVFRSGNTIRYATDTTGGNSGSAVLDENNQVVIGVHTNAGCNSTGGNQGTSIFNNDLQNALANPRGICLPRDIQASVVMQPTHVQPEGGDEITLQIDNLQGHTVVGVPKFIVNATDGTSFEQDMVDNGDGTYTGTFGSYYCGSAVSYSFELEDEQGTIVSVPSTGTYSTIALDDLAVSFEDDFESNLGWSSYSTGGTASFIRAEPNGYGLGDPGSDADGSGACYVTSNINGSDVDGGTVWLQSPPINIAGLENGVVRMSVWMTGTDPDAMTIEFSGNAGISFNEVMSIASTNGEWMDITIDIDEQAPTTSIMMVRVSVTDAGADTTVEGGVDAFSVASEVCDSSACPADLTGDGDVNFFDVSSFLDAYNAMDPVADFNGDGSFDFFDVSAFLVAFDAGCP